MTMPLDPLHVTVIVGSARDGRLAPHLTGWLLDQLEQHDDVVVDVVDVAETPMPDSLAADAPAVVALRPRLARSDAFVIVVPEYNRSIPGPLKTLIDCFNEEWQAKPVGFVSYGLSMAGGVRAVEHLRQIFAEFHAVGMKDIVTFPRVLEFLGTDGSFVGTQESAAAAKLMLDQLSWWARALHSAKVVRPYGT
jgi:NAD(P)H-dependent FMN reductase